MIHSKYSGKSLKKTMKLMEKMCLGIPVKVNKDPVLKRWNYSYIKRKMEI